MFARAKMMWRLNEAAMTVQNLLEQHGCPYAKDVAYKWVAEINAQKPELFNGRLGQRPHKISIAAIALAQGFDGEYGYAEPYVRDAIETIVAEVKGNERLYLFNGIDNALIEAVNDLYLNRIAQTRFGTY